MGWRSRWCRTLADPLRAFVFCCQWIENMAVFIFIFFEVVHFKVSDRRSLQRRAEENCSRVLGIFMSETMMACSKAVEEVWSDTNISWKQSQQDFQREMWEKKGLKDDPKVFDLSSCKAGSAIIWDRESYSEEVDKGSKSGRNQEFNFEWVQMSLRIQFLYLGDLSDLSTSLSRKIQFYGTWGGLGIGWWEPEAQ